jgi:hypothetical protein
VNAIAALALGLLLAAPILAEGAAATHTGCLRRYIAEDVGPVHVVSPDSCTYSVYVDGVAYVTVYTP